MDGQLHIRLDLRDCPDVGLLESRAPETENRIANVIRRAGAAIRECQFRAYAPEQGYTLFVIIEESFILIQTWPEWKWVNIDVMVCHYTKDNRKIARRIAEELKKFFGGWPHFEDEKDRGPWDELCE